MRARARCGSSRPSSTSPPDPDPGRSSDSVKGNFCKCMKPSTVLNRQYLSHSLTDFAKSKTIFSLGTVGSFHLLRPRSQGVSFKV